MWLLLIILGIITYFLVKRSVAPITRTPIWIVWLVMMAPAFIWTAWYMMVGEDEPVPLIVVILPLFLCFSLYWWLIQIGRKPAEARQAAEELPPSQNQQSAIAADEPANVRPISVSEEKSLRDCFPWAVYYLQNLDYRPQAILCRGKLRSAPEVAYQTIKENVEKVFGDRFLVLFQESFQGQPFFALIPNPWTKTQPSTSENEPLTRPVFASILLLITFLTTTVIGAELAGITVEKLQTDWTLLQQGLPYSLGIIAILGFHELSHYLAAVSYKIRTTLPYFIPVPFFLGTFGAFIQMKSPVPHRKSLFDVAIAGPIGGFVVTVPLLLWGLSLSEIVAVPEKSTLLSFEALDPRFSFLFAVFTKFVFGNDFTGGQAIHLHPLAVAGYVGLIVTALNLMPVGQLDGGHVVHAMYGQRTAIVVGQITRLCVLLLALIRPDFLLWAIILFLMPIADQPALNDVTELDNKRDILGLLSLALLISILLPVPDAIAGWLNI